VACWLVKGLTNRETNGVAYVLESKGLINCEERKMNGKIGSMKPEAWRPEVAYCVVSDNSFVLPEPRSQKQEKLR
jgi:hypothetical protein